MNIDEKLESLYAEVGEHCPYKVAKHIGIKLYKWDLFDKLCGIYQVGPDGTPIIVLNCSFDIETQETTCYLMVKHHKSHPGIGLSLNKLDIKMYERSERVERKFLKRAAETFLGFITNTNAQESK